MKRLIKALLVMILITLGSFSLTTSALYRPYYKHNELTERMSQLSNSKYVKMGVWQLNSLRNIEKLNSYKVRHLNLAKAVTFFYTMETGETLVKDNSWKQFMAIFENVHTEDCLRLVAERYGYPASQQQAAHAYRLSQQFDHVNLHLLMNGWDDNRYGYYIRDNYYYEIETEMNSYIWALAYSIGGGNPFYLAAVRKNYEPYQCTTFAWFRYWQVYGEDSGADGNGRFNAAEIVADHPFKFRLADYPAPGATFSKQPYYERGAGHVGFIEAMDDRYIWFSDGNSDVNGLLRINYCFTIERFLRYVGSNCQYAIPID